MDYIDENTPAFFFLVALATTYIAPIIFVQYPQGGMTNRGIFIARSIILWALTGAGWVLLFVATTEVSAASSWVRMPAAYLASMLTTIVAGCMLLHVTLKRPQ